MGMSKVSNGNRSRLEITAGILSKLQTPAGTTHLMLCCNLSSAQLGKYLTFMKSSGLIQFNTTRGRATYEMTETGKEFLNLFNRIVLLIGGWRKTDDQTGYINATMDQNLVVAENGSGKRYTVMLFPFGKGNTERSTQISPEFVTQTEAKEFAVDWMRKHAKSVEETHV